MFGTLLREIYIENDINNKQKAYDYVFNNLKNLHKTNIFEEYPYIKVILETENGVKTIYIKVYYKKYFDIPATIYVDIKKCDYYIFVLVCPEICMFYLVGESQHEITYNAYEIYELLFKDNLYPQVFDVY